jgi:CBS-domain-containing membrane protein
MRIIDTAFKRNPRPYIIQSLLAFAAAAIILTFVEALTQTAIVAALGSSTFIVFATPNSRAARPRELIGGHIVAIVLGTACYFGLVEGVLERVSADYTFVPWLIGALAVGLSLFLMTVTDTEHPPAAGTALGIVAQGWVTQAIVFVVVYAICLSVLKRLLGHRIVNLY